MKHIPGLRCFLLVLLKLITLGEEISVSDVDELLQKGAASCLSEQYKELFEDFGFSKTNYDDVDSFFKSYIGSVDDCEKKYGVDRSHGYALLIAYGLNEL